VLRQTKIKAKAMRLYMAPILTPAISVLMRFIAHLS